MKLGKILIAGASLAAFAAPVAGQTFSWSFDNGWNGAPDQFVTGTISLMEGVNAASGLLFTVTSTPNGQGLGSFTWYGTGTFTVTDGQVTYANALFGDDNHSLYFGTQPGDGTYNPEYQGYIQFGPGEIELLWDFSSNDPTLFTRADAPAPTPEPASWAMMVGGFGLAGAAMRRGRNPAVRFG